MKDTDTIPETYEFLLSPALVFDNTATIVEEIVLEKFQSKLNQIQNNKVTRVRIRSKSGPAAVQVPYLPHSPLQDITHSQPSITKQERTIPCECDLKIDQKCEYSNGALLPQEPLNSIGAFEMEIPADPAAAQQQHVDNAPDTDTDTGNLNPGEEILFYEEIHHESTAVCQNGGQDRNNVSDSIVVVNDSLHEHEQESISRQQQDHDLVNENNEMNKQRDLQQPEVEVEGEDCPAAAAVIPGSKTIIIHYRPKLSSVSSSMVSLSDSCSTSVSISPSPSPSDSPDPPPTFDDIIPLPLHSLDGQQGEHEAPPANSLLQSCNVPDEHEHEQKVEKDELVQQDAVPEMVEAEAGQSSKPIPVEEMSMMNSMILADKSPEIIHQDENEDTSATTATQTQAEYIQKEIDRVIQQAVEIDTALRQTRQDSRRHEDGQSQNICGQEETLVPLLLNKDNNDNGSSSQEEDGINPKTREANDVDDTLPHKIVVDSSILVSTPVTATEFQRVASPHARVRETRTTEVKICMVKVTKELIGQNVKRESFTKPEEVNQDNNQDKTKAHTKSSMPMESNPKYHTMRNDNVEDFYCAGESTVVMKAGTTVRNDSEEQTMPTPSNVAAIPIAPAAVKSRIDSFETRDALENVTSKIPTKLSKIGEKNYAAVAAAVPVPVPVQPLPSMDSTSTHMKETNNNAQVNVKPVPVQTKIPSLTKPKVVKETSKSVSQESGNVTIVDADGDPEQQKVTAKADENSKELFLNPVVHLQDNQIPSQCSEPSEADNVHDVHAADAFSKPSSSISKIPTSTSTKSRKKKGKNNVTFNLDKNNTYENDDTEENSNSSSPKLEADINTSTTTTATTSSKAKAAAAEQNCRNSYSTSKSKSSSKSKKSCTRTPVSVPTIGFMRSLISDGVLLMSDLFLCIVFIATCFKDMDDLIWIGSTSLFILVFTSRLETSKFDDRLLTRSSSPLIQSAARFRLLRPLIWIWAYYKSAHNFSSNPNSGAARTHFADIRRLYSEHIVEDGPVLIGRFCLQILISTFTTYSYAYAWNNSYNSNHHSLGGICIAFGVVSGLAAGRWTWLRIRTQGRLILD